MLQRTVLYDAHLAAAARMVEFGGWEMPVQYRGLLEEHRAVRERAGIFDISHMGRVMVRGPRALSYLQHLITNDLAGLPAGQSTYGLMCNEAGGIIDDVFVYHVVSGEYLVVINAGNRTADIAWMLQHAAAFDVQVDDYSDRWAMIAVQGPQAEALTAALPSRDAGAFVRLPFHGVTAADLFGIELLAARTGYTGEDGFELFVPAERAAELWQRLADPNGPALAQCGLGARDSLRFEACLALYGHEISLQVNPYEARLGWVVKLGKGEFIGRDALTAIKNAGITRRLSGIELIEKGIARADYPIHDLSGRPIGIVTSGMPAPTVGGMLAMGFVPLELSQKDSEFAVVVRDRPVRARVRAMPFYTPRYKR
jgi:aminomethyltransferase